MTEQQRTPIETLDMLLAEAMGAVGKGDGKHGIYIQELAADLRAALSHAEGEAVKFTCHGNSAPAYSCNKPGDMSGTYYPAPQVAVPEGWKLVPVEPTPEQVEAAMVREAPFGVGAWYRAMLAAAPTAPAGEQPVSDPDGFPDITSTVVNDACWTFIEAMPHQLPAPIFNDLKPALYEALKHYHRAALPTPDEREIAATSITALQSAFYEGFEAGIATDDDADDAWERSSARLRAGKEGK